MTKPSLFSLHKRYRARKTADGDFVEETTLVDGKKVLGLDSKRGRPEVNDKTISTLEKRIWKRIKDEKIKAPDQKVGSANSLILRVASGSSILKQKILREEMVKISGKERSSSFFENRISKKNWKKWRKSMLRNSERTVRRNTKAKAKKLRKSLQEKRRANKQRKT